MQSAASGSNTPVWTAHQYTNTIETVPGLSALARTPFVLRVMADALPRLEKHSSAGGSATGRIAGPRRVTRAQVYREFLAESWEAEARRLQRNRLPGLPPDYDAVTSFRNFGMDLATDMLARDQLAVESTAGLYTRGGLGTSEWARYFADDALTTASRQGCSLRRSGRLYSFVHKSVVEYLAASSIWDDITASAAAVAAAQRGGRGPATGGPATRGTARGGTGLGAVVVADPSRVGPGFDPAQVSSAAANAAAALPVTSSMNRVPAGAHPAVLQFLEDMLLTLPRAVVKTSADALKAGPVTADVVVTFESVVAFLHGVVAASCQQVGAATPAAMLRDGAASAASAAIGAAYLWAASNAASLLAQAGVSLHGVKWAGAKLQVRGTVCTPVGSVLRSYKCTHCHGREDVCNSHMCLTS